MIAQDKLSFSQSFHLFSVVFAFCSFNLSKYWLQAALNSAHILSEIF
jgi:hypothetical protein